MEDTKIDGRLDIVIFTNGGWEFIGKIPADPEIPEDVYMPEVRNFVAANQELPEPKKFTSFYRIKDDRIIMKWGDWQGEIQSIEPAEFNPFEIGAIPQELMDRMEDIPTIAPLEDTE